MIPLYFSEKNSLAIHFQSIYLDLFKVRAFELGGLLGLGGSQKAATPAVKVTPEEESTLTHLVQSALESKMQSPALGQRDQLLYDDRFPMIVSTFNARTGRNLTPHDVWRLVAKLAK